MKEEQENKYYISEPAEQEKNYCVYETEDQQVDQGFVYGLVLLFISVAAVVMWFASASSTVVYMPTAKTFIYNVENGVESLVGLSIDLNGDGTRGWPGCYDPPVMGYTDGNFTK